MKQVRFNTNCQENKINSLLFPHFYNKSFNFWKTAASLVYLIRFISCQFGIDAISTWRLRAHLKM